MRISSSYLSDRTKDDLIAMYGGDIDLSRPDKGRLLLITMCGSDIDLSRPDNGRLLRERARAEAVEADAEAEAGERTAGLPEPTAATPGRKAFSEALAACDDGSSTPVDRQPSELCNAPGAVFPGLRLMAWARRRGRLLSLGCLVVVAAALALGVPNPAVAEVAALVAFMGLMLAALSFAMSVVSARRAPEGALTGQARAENLPDGREDAAAAAEVAGEDEWGRSDDSDEEDSPDSFELRYMEVREEGRRAMEALGSSRLADPLDEACEQAEEARRHYLMAMAAVDAQFELGSISWLRYAAGVRGAYAQALDNTERIIGCLSSVNRTDYERNMAPQGYFDDLGNYTPDTFRHKMVPTGRYATLRQEIDEALARNREIVDLLGDLSCELTGVCLADGEEATGDAADNLRILIGDAPAYRSARLAASDEEQGGEQAWRQRR